MNYKLLFQIEAEQNKLLQKKIKEYEKELNTCKLLQDTYKKVGDEAVKEISEYKALMEDMTNRITSYTQDLEIDIKV